MEDILELILTIVLTPFELKHNKLRNKLNKIPNKPLRISLKVLIILIQVAIFFGLCLLLNYWIRGYWI